MFEQKLDRRAFFGRALLLGVGAVGAGAVLTACENSGGGAATPKTPKVDCSDVSALSEAELNTRNSLKYVDVTPIPAKVCDNCKLYVEKPPCNGCTVVPGPIAAKGYCAAWVAKA